MGATRSRFAPAARLFVLLLLVLVPMARGQDAVDDWRLDGIISALDDAYPGVHAEALLETKRLLTSPDLASNDTLRERADGTIDPAYATSRQSGAGAPTAAVEAASQLVGAAGWCSEANLGRLREHFSNANGLVARAAIEAYCVCGGALTDEDWTTHGAGRKLQRLAILTCRPPDAVGTVGGSNALPLLPFLLDEDHEIRLAAAHAVRRDAAAQQSEYADTLERALQDRTTDQPRLHSLEVALTLRKPTGTDLEDVLAWTHTPEATIDSLRDAGVVLESDRQVRLATGSLDAGADDEASIRLREATLYAIARLGEPESCTAASACGRLLTDALRRRDDDLDQPLDAALALLSAIHAREASIAPWTRGLETVIEQWPSTSIETRSTAAELLWSCCASQASARLNHLQAGASKPSAPWLDSTFTQAAICGSGTNPPRQALALAMLEWSARADWSAADLADLARTCQADLSDTASNRTIYLRLLDEAMKRDASEPLLQAISLSDLGESERVREGALSRLRVGGYLNNDDQLAQLIGPAIGSLDEVSPSEALFQLRFLAHYLSGGSGEARSVLQSLAHHAELDVAVMPRDDETFLRGNDLVPLLVGWLASETSSSAFRDHLVERIDDHLAIGGGWKAWNDDVRARIDSDLQNLPQHMPMTSVKAALRKAARSHFWRKLPRAVFNFCVKKPLLSGTIVLIVIGLIAMQLRPALATALKRALERDKESNPLTNLTLVGLDLVTFHGRLLGAGRARRAAAASLRSQDTSAQRLLRPSSQGRMIFMAGAKRPVETILQSLRRPLLLEGAAASGLSSLAQAGRPRRRGNRPVRLTIQAHELEPENEPSLRALIERRLTDDWSVWTDDLLNRGELEIFVDSIEALHPAGRKALFEEMSRRETWRVVMLTHAGVVSDSDLRGLQIDRAELQPISGQHAKAFLVRELGGQLDEQTAFRRIEDSPLIRRIISDHPSDDQDGTVAACGTPVELHSIAQMLIADQRPETLSDVLAFQVNERIAVIEQDDGDDGWTRLEKILRARSQQRARWLMVEANHRDLLRRLRRVHLVTFRHLGQSMSWSFRHKAYIESLQRALDARKSR